MFKQYNDKISYPKIEEEVLKFWDENNIFEKSISTRDENKPFTFYEGPPTANGKPGLHHVIARTIKDLVCRYKTMKGYQVHRKAGWDTHGLPVEIEVEKKLGIKEKSEIPKFGVAKYNAACRESVFTYKDLWDKMTTRMGYWINLEDAYITCDNNYIESVWWALKTLFEKGLIYKDYKIVPQCPRSQTVLSSHELALGYRETKDPSVYVVMKITDTEFTKGEEVYFLVWTTTPWTLISNVALAVGSDIEYAKVKTDGANVILAKERLGVLRGEYEILESYKGSELAGIHYDQLFKYKSVEKDAFYVIEGDFVSTEDGSGIVHIAPAFGADDYEISKKYDLPFMQPVNRAGKFTEEITDFAGMFVKDADLEIIKMLREMGSLYKKETIVHSYPFSWRYDDVPVIYYARESWFIRTTAIADRMVQLNNSINWYPPEVGSGRFGNWLEDNKDWALSRDRFWATPLPIWVSDDGDMFAIGSIEELKEGFVERDGQRISVSDIDDIDLHKPFVDEVKFERNGKIFTRTSELIDVWFDSGSMPFAQWHYPFENKEIFENGFPSDFICEGIDQTRGWFYTMHAISTMLFDDVAYKNLIVNELILDKNGMKMSKSKGNTVNPFELFDKYGADAARWYLIIASPPWRPTLFDEAGVVEVQRKFFGTLLNTYSFFALYANIDGFQFEEEEIPFEERPEIDRWILSKLHSLVDEFEKSMERFDVTRAARAVSAFTIDQLSNWYVRRSRRRFWKSELNDDKLSAYQSLYECLLTVAKLTAPFAPFLAEDIYQNLNNAAGKESAESVHLVNFPDIGEIDKELEARMELAQNVVYLTRSIRAKNNLKVRQPLNKILVSVNVNGRDALEVMKNVILDEVNIKTLEVLESDSGIVNKSAKANFKVIGPKYGKHVKKLAAEIQKFSQDRIEELEKNQEISVDLDGEIIRLLPEDVDIMTSSIEGWFVESDSGVTVAVDTELDENLIAEGYAREFVNRIQNLRKDSGFDVMDRINVGLQSDNMFVLYINKFSEYIKNEVLADNISGNMAEGNSIREFKIGEYNCSISVVKSEG